MLCWILNSDEDLTIDVFDEKNIYDVYQHVRESLLPLIEQNDLVVLDFTGVNVVCSSFADECIAKLLLHMRLTELKSREPHYVQGTKSYCIGMRAYISSTQTFGYRIRIFDISRHMTTFAIGYHNRSGKKA